MSDSQRLNIPEKRSSLADMARAAARRSSQPPPSEVESGLLDIRGGSPLRAPPPLPPAARLSSVGTSDDSGLIDLKALQPPKPAPVKPAAVSALDTLNPASVSVAPPSPFDVSIKQALAEAELAKPEVRGQSRRMIPIAAAMLLATAAGIGGTYLMTRGQNPQPTAAVQTTAAVQPPAAQAAQAAAPAQDKAPPAAEQANAAAAPAAESDQANPAPEGRGAVPEGKNAGRGGPHSRVSSRGGAAAPAVAAPAREKQTENKAADNKTSEKLAVELAKNEAPTAKAQEPIKGTDPLAGAIQKAAGPIAKSEAIVVDKGPASQNSDMPEQPGKGAISGALSGPRGVAKTCLDGHNAPANVSVIFGSDGKVQTVNVTGAGTATDCVKKAFGRANVGQFRRATFPVSVTITPP